jgi:hypothetical protein
MSSHRASTAPATWLSRRYARMRRYRSDMSRLVALAFRLFEWRGWREQLKGRPPPIGPHGSQAGGSPLTGT